MKKLLIISILALGVHSAEAQTSDINQSSSVNVQKVKVFPNPATNVINILGLQNSSRADIQISDTYGNAMLSHSWAIKNNAVNIPITNLDTGIYIVTIRSEEQQVQTKFYKQ